MTDLRLPCGTSFIVHLFRPMPPQTHCAVAPFVTITPIGPGEIAAAIAKDRDMLLAALPELLAPGAPVCLVITASLAGDRAETECVVTVAEMPRALHRWVVGEEIFARVPDLVRELAERLRPHLEKEAA